MKGFSVRIERFNSLAGIQPASCRTRFVQLLAGISIFLQGCGHQIDKIDYGKVQSAAAILVSDPQIYERASLINDRRQEADYLKKLLTLSTLDDSGMSKIQFTPQILRDLKTVDAISASLGLNAGLKTNGASEIAGLNQQIQKAQLQAQLETLNKQIEGIKAAKAPDVTVAAPNLSSTMTPANTGTSVTSPDVTAIQKQIDSIRAQLEKFASVTITGPSVKDYGPEDPHDDFEDRQAYRRDVRAALAEAQLDDVHDRSGNALYRLQFRATVLPLSNDLKQWGAAKATILPPKISGDQLTDYYFNWLSYLTNSLNSNARNPDYDRFVREVGNSGLFKIVDLVRLVTYINPANPSLGVRSDDYYCFNHTGDQNTRLSALPSVAGQTPFGFGGYVVPTSFTLPCGEYGSYDAKLTADQRSFLLNILFYGVSGGEGVTSFTRNAPGLNAFPNNQELEIGSLRNPYRFTYDNALQAARQAYPNGPPETAALPVARSGYVPEAFCLILVEASAGTDCRTQIGKSGLPAKGGKPGDAYAVKAYSVFPTEMAQRLGVTAQAAESVELALGVAAQLSGALSAALNAGTIHDFDARTQAVFRQPLVVGFSGTEVSLQTHPLSDPDPKGAYFGWLFGPQFMLDNPKDLQLQQMVRNYGANADISVPGWWNRLSLKVETAWIGSWAKDGALLQDAAAPTTVLKTVALPLNQSTLEALTSFIAAETSGLQYSQIFVSSVEPNLIPACATTVKFRVMGQNIWRANRIFLGGAEATDVTVLPDMKGISAEFDMAKVYGGLLNAGSSIELVPLSVSSEQGAGATQIITVVGIRQSVNGNPTCQSPIALPTTLSFLNPTVIAGLPAKACLDAKSVTLSIDALKFDFEHDEDTNIANAKRLVSIYGFKDGSLDGSGTHFLAALQADPGITLYEGNFPVVVKLVNALNNTTVHKQIAIGTLELSDCKKQASMADAKPKAATLITKGVKLADKQTINLRANIPAGYYQLVMNVRKKGTNDKWLSSGNLNSVSGDNSSLEAVFDLSKIKGDPAKDKLEVRLLLTDREGLEPNPIPTDLDLAILP